MRDNFSIHFSFFFYPPNISFFLNPKKNKLTKSNKNRTFLLLFHLTLCFGFYPTIMYEVPQIGEFFCLLFTFLFPFLVSFHQRKKKTTTTTTIPKTKHPFLSFFAPSKITPTVITDNKFYCSAYIWPPVKISFSFVFCHTLFAEKRKKNKFSFCPYCSPPQTSYNWESREDLTIIWLSFIFLLLLFQIGFYWNSSGGGERGSIMHQQGVKKERKKKF